MKKLHDLYGSVIISGQDVIRVYDCDTFTVDIPTFPRIIGEEINIRVYGIDGPEIRGKTDAEKELAIKARDFVREQLFSAESIELRNLNRDKYFRLLAKVFVDGESLADMLFAKRYAIPYFGNTKVSWDDPEQTIEGYGLDVPF